MCGIAGYLYRGTRSYDSTELLRTMSDCLEHRGPDSSGLWFDDEAGIGLSHRRLSILDLSALGHQPMTSANDRYIIVYNGEVYNFLEIRETLAQLGHQFRGDSDTEVLLASISAWGIEKTVGLLNGMFAFAVWDKQERQLHLGRDRMGIKPLYYGIVGGALVFASELSPITKFPGFSHEIDRGALTLLMRYNYITAPHSIYKNVKKLPPGTTLSLDIETIQQRGLDSVEPKQYWSLKDVVERGVNNQYEGSHEEATLELEALLMDAVKKRMIADVPLGAFLSGGVDSSLVVALMQAQSTKRVKTFTIGFEDEYFNEAIFAKEVASHLGTDHTELYVTPQQAIDVIPVLPKLYDEPFADSSQIPTYLVSKLARKDVTVSLSGDGGDELFAGYDRFRLGNDLWPKLQRIPRFGRLAVKNMIGAVPDPVLDASFSWLNPFLLKYSRPGPPSRKFNNVAELMSHNHFIDMYSRTISAWYPSTSLVRQSDEPYTIFSSQGYAQDEMDLISQMMYWETTTYLPDDILVKVDRASMGVSLEARVPLLDHRVVELAWRLPVDWKYDSVHAKKILRSVLYKHVPRELIEREKAGFAIPLDAWLRTDLRDWAEDLLDERKLNEQGYFNTEMVRQKWADHLDGHDVGYYLWDVLMFQAWLS